MWWILVALVLLIVIVGVAVLFSGSSNKAVGYTREHGYCPNMGACDSCDLCEGD